MYPVVFHIKNGDRLVMISCSSPYQFKAGDWITELNHLLLPKDRRLEVVGFKDYMVHEIQYRATVTKSVICDVYLYDRK